MAKNLLGVEFGENRVKLVEIKGDSIVQFVTEETPEGVIKDGEIIAWDALTEMMSEIIHKHHFKIKDVCVVIPDSLTYTRRLKMPLMNEAQVKVNLPFEFRDFITDEKELYIYDYAVLGTEKDDNGIENMLDVLGVAIRRDLIEKYREMFTRLKLNFYMAAPECLALGALVKVIAPNVATHDYAILDIGYSATRVNIFSDGVFETTRSIELGTKAIHQAIAKDLGCDERLAALYMVQNTNNVLASESVRDICDSIAVDVMRAINYYTYEKRDNTLEVLYTCGGGSLIGPLLNELRETVPLQVEELANIGDNKLDNATLNDGPAAVGICWNDRQ
jgi:type IV pilus assembly protein PilM